MNTTSKLALWAGAAALVVGMAGCSSQTAAPAPADAAPVTSSSHTSDEQAYLTLVHGLVANSSGVDDQTILDVGHSVCDAFESGASYDMVLNVTEPGLGKTTAAEMIGGATGTICPEYADELPR